MKAFLLVILLIWNFCTAQESERIHIDFTSDNDSFPDCNTVFFANGYYSKPSLELIPLDLPNVTAVHPAELTFNKSLNFRSFGSEAEKYGSMEFDQTQVVPYSRDEVINLIRETEDSARANWLVNDNVYLWENFQILHDAKPVEKVAKVDSSASVRALFPVNEPVYGIIYGVFIPEGGFVRLERFNLTYLSDEFHAEDKHVHKNIQPLLDSLLKPFYLSNYELTNGQYRKFIEWVSDSIELQMAYDSLSDENALWLLNCSKKELKSLDPSRRKENKYRFGLTRKNRRKISDQDWTKATEGMFYPIPQRYYRRRERKMSILKYKQANGMEIAIYPDTTGFCRKELGMTGNYFARLSWHPAYRNYPIVNLSKEQILAYCHWKQQRLNDQFKEEGLKITVRPPYMRELEFAAKVGMYSTYYHLAISKPNTYFVPFLRDDLQYDNAFSFYQAVNYTPENQRKKRKEQNSFEPSLNYWLWYHANTVPNAPFIFLNGNVSEFVLDTVSTETWNYFEMGQNPPEKRANYVLGTNYYQDAKTIGDDQYNTSLYKTVLLDGESSPYVGVRLVYLVEKNDNN